MKKLIFCFVLLLVFTSCTILYDNVFGPKLKFKYNNEYTGIDTLLFMHGYYQSLDELSVYNSPKIRYEALMFFSNGLFCKVASNNPTDYFSSGKYEPTTWGNYMISKDTLKIQYINNYGLDGGIVVGNYDYLIKSFDEIIELPKNNKSSCGSVYRFHPLEYRIGYDNWLLKKKWFYKKGCYPKK